MLERATTDHDPRYRWLLARSKPINTAVSNSGAADPPVVHGPPVPGRFRDHAKLRRHPPALPPPCDPPDDVSTAQRRHVPAGSHPRDKLRVRLYPSRAVSPARAGHSPVHSRRTFPSPGG